MCAASHRVEFDPGEVPALLGITAIAIYGCVPETDQMPTIGWMLVGLFVIEIVTRAACAWPITTLAAMIVLWSGLYGATGRGSAIVGALFAFWPIVLVIGSEVLWGPLQRTVRWMTGAIGGVAAIAVARTGAIQPTTAPAIVAAAIAAAVSVVAVSALATSRR